MSTPLRQEHPKTASRARALRTNLTDAEQRLWMHLRRRQVDGHRFRRQVPMGPFVADFACLEQKLVIEVDGGQHAETEKRDLDRTAWLNDRGYRVMRFWNHDVMSQTEAVLEEILRRLEGDGR